MAGVNKVILIGNLGADPEIRHLPSGSVVATFNIATSESYTNRQGEKVTQTEWHRIELWEGLARIAEQYLKKGRTVYIEGKLRTEQWQDNEGVSKSTTKIRATSMTLLGGRADGDQPFQQGAAQQGSEPNFQSAPPVSADPQPPIIPDNGGEDADDLPF